MDHTTKVTAKDGSEFILFANGWCPLSSYHPSPFCSYAVHYRSPHQMYQSLKAKHFGDLAAYKMIMKSASSKTQSEIASTIDNFNADEWKKKAPEVMERALRLKFAQNSKDRECLLGTGDATIVFSSRFQTYWGNGLDIRDERNNDTSMWQGSNILGSILMKLRKEFS